MRPDYVRATRWAACSSPLRHGCDLPADPGQLGREGVPAQVTSTHDIHISFPPIRDGEIDRPTDASRNPIDTYRVDSCEVRLHLVRSLAIVRLADPWCVYILRKWTISWPPML